MDTRSVNDMKDEVNLEIELLNQACLDLVAQIYRLKKENARLKKEVKGENEAGKGLGLSDH